MLTLADVIDGGLISSDSHVIEPPTLWVERVDRRFRASVPCVQRINGNDWWIYAGRKIGSVSGRKRRSGSALDGSQPVASQGAVLTHSVFDDVDPAAWTPALYVAANLADGVVGAVIRPTQGLTSYCIDDSALFGAMCRAYNDWIAEFCHEDPARLKALAMLDSHDPAQAVLELERAKKRGLVGGIISCYPGADCHYGLPAWERLWAAAASHHFPLSLHVLSNHAGPYGVPFEQMTYSLRVNADHWLRMSIADMIFSGVFERHPGLMVESSEHEGGWVPYFLWQMDWTWERRIKRRLQANAIPHPPSQYFRNNVFVSIIYDELAIAARDIIGIDRLMWGSDYPHEQSSHPHSRTMLAGLLADVEPAAARAIVRTNAGALFGFTDAASTSEAPDRDQHRSAFRSAFIC